MNKPIKKNLVLGFSLLISLLTIACQTGKKEISIKNASTGDLLVSVGKVNVMLASDFKPGEANGLYDGSVRIKQQGEPDKFVEINVICSLPELDDWQQYDNIYGRYIDQPSDAGKDAGQTDWQTLLPFEGNSKELGPDQSPIWAKRLAENLCRKGDFDDKNIT